MRPIRTSWKNSANTQHASGCRSSRSRRSREKVFRSCSGRWRASYNRCGTRRQREKKWTSACQSKRLRYAPGSPNRAQRKLREKHLASWRGKLRSVLPQPKRSRRGSPPHVRHRASRVRNAQDTRPARFGVSDWHWELATAFMNVALFGGTFDPIHRGHLAVAHAASERFHLGRVYFVPADI